MAEKIQKNKPVESKAKAKEGKSEVKVLTAKGEELKEDMDDLIDAIDEILEENAAEFVKNYVQRGGE